MKRIVKSRLDDHVLDLYNRVDDVKKDILAWYPKIKKGGIIAGHDFTTFDGVRQAVDELIINKGMNYVLKNSYWIHKK